MTDKVKLTQEEYDNLVKLLNATELDMFDILREIRDNYSHKLDELNCNLFGNETAELDRAAQIEFIKDPLSYVEVEEKKYYVHLIKNDKWGYLNIDLSTGEIKVDDKSQTHNHQTQFTKDEINNFKNIAFTIEDENIAFTINDDALEEVEE